MLPGPELEPVPCACLGFIASAQKGALLESSKARVAEPSITGSKPR